MNMLTTMIPRCCAPDTSARASLMISSSISLLCVTGLSGQGLWVPLRFLCALLSATLSLVAAFGRPDAVSMSFAFS